MKIYDVKMVKTEMALGPLNFVEKKNPFVFLQTKLKADAWGVCQLVFEKSVKQPLTSSVIWCSLPPLI